MINSFLHAVTNQAELPGDIFTSDPNFVPASLPAAAIMLRHKLCLDYTGSDYYLRTYAATVDAFPDILEQLNDPVRSYEVSDFLPAGVWTDGARFMNDGNLRGGYLDLIPASLPIGLTYTITYVSDNSCSILQEETGISVAAMVTTAEDPINRVIYIDWPGGLPFAGPMLLDQDWAEGSVIRIQTAPGMFPFQEVVAIANNDPYFNLLLQSSGLVTAYQTTADPREQVAIILLLIALSNPAAYPQ
jgi:hypothetical protein